MFNKSKEETKKPTLQLKGAQPQQTTQQPVVAAAPPKPVEAKKEIDMNVIGKGTIIEGNVKTDGNLQVDGNIKGDVNTKNHLIVGKEAVVEGNILAANAEIAGRVKGTVQCSGLLAIRASCIIDGDVITKDLNVESGSTFNGRFQVGVSSSSSNDIFDDAPSKPANK